MIMKNKNHLISILILILLAVAVYYPFLIQNKRLLIQGDMPSMWLPFKQFVLMSFHKGDVPLWNPYIFCGYPFLAAGQAGIFYPPDLMFFIIKNIIQAFNLNIFIHILIFSIGIYIFFIMSGYKPEISVLGAGVMMLSGQMTAHLYAGHYPHLHSLAWMPWTLMLLKKSFDEKCAKYFILAGCTLSMQILSGFPQYTYMTIQLGVLIVISEMIYKKTSRDRIRPLLLFIGMGILAGGISAIQVLPSLEVMHYFNRGTDAFVELSSTGSLEWIHLLRFMNPDFLGSPLDEKTAIGKSLWYWWEMCPYIGILPLIMVVPVLLNIKKMGRREGFWLFVIIFFLIISLGDNSGIYPLILKIVPGMKTFRVPARYLLFVTMGLVCLFMRCAEMIMDSTELNKRKIVLIILGVIVFIDLSYNAHKIVYREFPVPSFNPIFSGETEPLKFLKKDKDIFRITGLGKYFFYNEGMLHGMFSPAGYDSVILMNYNRFLDVVENNTKRTTYISPEIRNFSSAIFGMLNVKYLFADETITTPLLESVYKSYKLNIYQYKNVLPRFYFVNKVNEKKNTEDIEEGLDAAPFNPSNEAIVLNMGDKIEIPDSNFPSSSGLIEIKRYEPNRIVLETLTSKNSYLVTSEAYYPGWRLLIDSKESKIFETNLAFRGFTVPEGKHHIEMVFRPITYFVGKWISIMTNICLLAYGILLIYRQINRKKHS